VDYTLGGPMPIGGTEYVRIPLRPEASSSSMEYASSSSSYGGYAANYLFLNSRTGVSSWLLPTARQLFIAELLLSETLHKQGNDKIAGIVYALVDKDTDGDGRLSARDTITVAASAADGSGFHLLTKGVDRLFALTQIADDRFLILYQKKQETVSELYDIAAMKKLAQHTVPTITSE
jgi:hypothetical protein